MSASSRILFIRHAETDLAGTFCGHSNPPVNTRGLGQIRTLLEALRNEPIDTVYTSDLERAFTTADAISNAVGLVTIHEPRLREIHFGDWEGLTWSEVEQRDPAYAQRWLDGYPSLPAPGGESFQTFQARVLTTIEQLRALGGHRSVAVVTHAGVMRVVLERLHRLSKQESWTITKPYCSFFEYAEEQPAPVQP